MIPAKPRIDKGLPLSGIHTSDQEEGQPSLYWQQYMIRMLIHHLFLNAYTDKLFAVWQKDVQRHSIENLINTQRKWEKEYRKRGVDWQNIYQLTDQFFPGFLPYLEKEFPQLSETDIRQCLLFRYGFSYKETGQLLGLSESGIEGARYRILRKMELPKGSNLIFYLKSIP